MISRVEKFSFAITALYRHIRRIENYAATKYSLKGHSAFYLLALAGYEDGMTAAELSEKCERNKSEVSRTIKDLTARGYVIKRSSEANNHYRAKLCLTETGRKIAVELSELGDRLLLKIGTDVSQEEHDMLYRMIDIILGKLSSFDSGSVDCGDDLE
jgi:DNA-binding MarR family transcriptional regulator